MNCLLKTCLLFFLVTVAAEAQPNPTSYPFGGQPDESRRGEGMNIAPLNLSSAADFYEATFDSTANFGCATFGSTTVFASATFKSDAIFTAATFKDTTIFFNTTFDRTASFVAASFDSMVNFSRASFEGECKFVSATFTRKAYFRSCSFASGMDFQEARSVEYLDFERARINGRVRLGTHNDFRIDLTLAIFSPESEIMLTGPSELKLPIHKFEKLSLLGSLSYTEKQYVIDNLKERSFAGLKAAAFELDYILAKSTAYQDATDTYVPNTWYHVWKWPKWSLSWFYDVTMGFGYRPFRIIWWALGFIIGFTLFYFFKMGMRIDAYVLANYEPKADTQLLPLTRFETFLNCAYFSVMLFFTFRFKGNLLTFFDAKEKKFIIAEWLLGLAVYVAFLYHTSSVLQNIRSLFVGG